MLRLAFGRLWRQTEGMLGSRLVPYRHALATCWEDSQQPANRYPGAGECQGGDRRGLDCDLTSQGAWLVNYVERHRAGLRVGTSLTEATANSDSSSKPIPAPKWRSCLTPIPLTIPPFDAFT
jgi:hypothetical protein